MRMDVTQSAEMNMEPAVLRIVIERLGKWLPIGPVAVRGGKGDIEASLRTLGYEIADAGRSVATVVCSGAQDPEEIEGFLKGALESIDRVPVCIVLCGSVDQTCRVSWEKAMLSRQWRKHPLGELVAPYGELDRVTGLVMTAFEPLPDLAAHAYPLRALEEERDLHTDMMRESGRRSDAHLARYIQASRFVEDGDRVLDVACGLGYGSYQISRSTRAASVVGIDLSDYAVDYAKTNFSGTQGLAPCYSVGDAQDLSQMADGSADFAISIETLEHIPQPVQLLSELHRVLTPGGRLYASVPNDWSDESGKDPNPFHLHVYDWKALSEQFRAAGFHIEKAWLQDAGGGQKRHLAARSMLEVDPRRGPQCDGEWLLVLARKFTTDDAPRNDSLMSTVSDMLRAGGREEAMARLSSAAADSSQPLRRAASAMRLAALHAFSGDAARTQLAWSEGVVVAKPMLEEPALRRDAANLLALAYDALDHDGLSMVALLSRHPAAMALMELERFDPLLNMTDRAFNEGVTAEYEPLGLAGGQIRESLEAKRWLDQKYHEHVARIEELEAYTAQLEEARHWLDDQYHSLTEQVQRLRRAETSHGP